jgi:hypothetical protein
MGSFDEFLASLDEEAMGREIEKICPPEIFLDDFNAVDLNVLLPHLYQKLLLAASRISVLNLRAYHEWLQTQL